MKYKRLPSYKENKKQNEKMLELNKKDLDVYKSVKEIVNKKSVSKKNIEISIEDILEISNGKNLNEKEVEHCLYKLYRNYKVGYNENSYMSFPN